jgi:iron complex transport system ATP-binding protein
MGRTPHKRLTERLSRSDDELVAAALADVSASELADRQFHTLSGGEKQRVLLARALAQQPRVLILDEPTNHLDIRFQLEILAIVGRLGVTALAALHDLNLAATYCDQLVVLHEGRVVADGSPETVLTAGLVATVYGVDAEVGVHPSTGYVSVTYLPAMAAPASGGVVASARSGRRGPPRAGGKAVAGDGGSDHPVPELAEVDAGKAEAKAGGQEPGHRE